MAQTFFQTHRKLLVRTTGFLLFALGACATCTRAADFVNTVAASKPLAYYRLNATEGTSVVGPSQYRSIGGISRVAGPGAPIGFDSPFVRLHGRDGYILTTHAGSIQGAASMMAWVNLASLPSQANHIFYVMGESQLDNDLDLQFETDNRLKFYTAAGSHLTFAPPTDSLLNQWHMVVATMDTTMHTRSIYWDGRLVANDRGDNQPGKFALLSIGDSTSFRGRYFHGGIQEVALWNRALGSSEVSAMYATATAAPSAQLGSMPYGAEPVAAPGAAQYMGCFKDADDRDLKGHFWDDSHMTPERCLQSCSNAGFAYAGLQFASQCFCGNSYGKYGPLAASSCNLRCSGDTGLVCGGTWANTLYKTVARRDMPPVAPPPPPPRAPTNNITNPTPTATYMGCFRDTDQRDLSSTHWDDGQMTPNRCIRSCAESGSEYAAVQYGSHCFCGNSHGRYGRIDANSCNMPCSGDSGLTCGGAWANSVFRLR